jgi:predicted enzyme related to lactoylglutathione lyase
MTLSIATVTVDTTDPVPLAQWWADQLGGEVNDQTGGFFVIVVGGPVQMAFQKVEDPTPGKNRIHVDLMADDLDAEVERMLTAGAALVERRSVGSFHWVTLSDPDANEFCVAQAG